MNLKKTLALLLAATMGLALTACGGTSEEAPAEAESKEESSEAAEAPEAKEETESSGASELVVFAAASLTETVTELAESYEAEHEGVKIVCNFDSSGTLKTQIEEGADCDLFISAGQKQMDQLDIQADKEKNPDGLDFVNSETRVDFLENTVTLCVPEGNPKGIESFDQLAEKLQNEDVLMCMSNSDVPVGQYTQKILTSYNLNEEELAQAGKITYGTNVKEVATQISEGSVDCGVIYCTDAYSHNLTVVDSATSEQCGRVIYPAAVMKNSKDAEMAQDFLNYLKTEKAMETFKNVGFSIP